MESIVVEIRAAEGGADAKDLVFWLRDIYQKYASRLKLEWQSVENRPGIIVAKVSGRNALKAFEVEAGGHRVQRVPPTEKRGRVHTSTVTVAVLPILKRVVIDLPEKDLRWTFCRGSGAGGQHRNVTDSAVQLKHLPTGIQVRSESERSQDSNKITALEVLKARLQVANDASARNAHEGKRKKQVGSGMRGDKVFTVSIPRDQAVCHTTGKCIPFKKRYARGFLEDLQ